MTTEIRFFSFKSKKENKGTRRYWIEVVRTAPVNLTAQSGENSVSAKKRLKNLLYKPIILNSEPHSAQKPASPSETFFN